MSARNVKTLATDIQIGTITGLSEASFGEPVLHSRKRPEKIGRRGNSLRLQMAVALLMTLGVRGEAQAQRWDRMGPEGGMVVSLGTSPGGDIYLGTADGHVFGSEDGGMSWALLGRVGSRLDGVVARLVVDPHDKKTLFAAVWYQEAGAGGGIFRSTDGGRTWKPEGLEGEAVRALEIAPSRPEELVAGTRSGVFLSVNGGKEWKRISPEGDEELRNLDSLAIDPRDPEVIYAGTYHLPWMTKDGGKTWKVSSAGIIDDSDIMSLRVDAGNADRLYISACSGIYRSENRGASWTKLQGIPYAARRTQVIVQDPWNPKTLYAGTTEGLWVTRDGGESWTRTTPADWIVNSVVVLEGRKGERGRVVLGTEGRGIEVSEDAGVSFTTANRGFTHVIVRQLLADRNDPAHLLMVLERSGPEILESCDDGKNWESMALTAEESGRTARLNAELIQEAYASAWGWLLRLGNGQMWRWNNARKMWAEWQLKLPSVKPQGRGASATKGWKTAMMRAQAAGPVIAFSQGAAFVATNEGLARCLGSGACGAVKAFGGGQIRAVWATPTGGEVSAVMDGKLGWSTNGGETAAWKDLPVLGEEVMWLDAAQSGTEKTLYLGTSEGLFVWRSTDSRWDQVRGGLPAGQVERWLRAPGVWVLTERGGGVYVSRDDGSTWQRVDRDRERSRFTGLARTGDGTILAGSQSEGLLELKLREERAEGER